MIGSDRNSINSMNCSIFPSTWRKWLAPVLAFVSAIALSGCNPTEFKTEAAQVPQIVDSTLGDPKTFNYALSNESPNVFGFIYDGLITEDGLTGEIQPALAESWEISEDKKRIVFTMRENLKWSDGEPLTVDDVVFSYNDVYLNEKIPTDIKDILKIGKSRLFPKIRKLDERRVEFTVPEPFAPFLRNTGLVILPKHALYKSVITTDPKGNPQFLSKWGTDTDPTKIICNGPYTLERYNTSQRVVFRRNPYYWRKDAKGNPQPYIERFVWSIVENKDTQLLKFRSGDLDVSEPMRPEDFPLLKHEEKRGNFTVRMGGPRPVTTFIAFNLNKGRRSGKPLVDPVKSRWFNKVAFRQAIAYAINRESIINNTFRGLGATVNSPIIPQSPYYLSPEQGLKVYNYDLEKSKKLLLGAGFKYNSRGQLLDADGNRVRFTMVTNAENTIRVAMAAQIKQQLSKIGIQVDLNPINFNILVDKLDNSLDWESYLLGFTGSVEPNSGANMWFPDGGSHSFNQKPQAGRAPIEGREVAEWEEEIARLYIQAAQELDEEKRKEIYYQTQRITQENLPYIYLVNERLMAAVRDRIQGVKYSDLNGALWNLYELKVID